MKTSILLVLSAALLVTAGAQAGPMPAGTLLHYWAFEEDITTNPPGPNTLYDTARDWPQGAPAVPDADLTTPFYPQNPAIALNPGRDGGQALGIARYTGASSTLTDFGSTFTMETWFMWTGVGNNGWAKIMSDWNGSPVFLQLGNNQVNSLQVGGVTVVYVNPYTDSLILNQWAHIAVVADAANSTVKLYITPDGGAGVTQVGPTCTTYSGSSAAANGFTLGNGGKYGGYGYYDSMVLWNVALDEATLTDHYLNGWQLTPATTGSLTIKKFFDCDQNGLKDYTDDNLLPNWEYHITGPGGYDQTLTTDGTGQIALTGLDPGDYTVTETVWQDHTITGGRSNPTIVTIAGGDDKTEMFGNILAGDVNQDGLVDSIDFTILKANYGLSPKTWVQGNLNPLEDTLVDSIDFTILKAYFGQGVPPGPGAVPEPASAALLVVGLAGAVLRRRAR